MHGVLGDIEFGHVDVPYGYAAGSVTDLAQLAMLHTNAGSRNGTPVLSERAVADLHHAGPAAAGGHYGPGWRIGTLDSVGARIVWHAGAVTGYHTIVIAAPQRGWAIAVQHNAWSFLRDADLNAAGFGALTLALGGTPDPPAPSSASLPLLAPGTVILVLVVGLVVAVRRLARRHPGMRRRWPTVLGAATGTAAGVVSAAGVGWWLPHAFDLDLRHILRFQPDLGHLAITIIALGLTLTATTAALLIRTLLGRRAQPPAQARSGGRFVRLVP